jgi:hypothetical protein
MTKNTKMCRIKYSNAIKHKFKGVDLINSILKHDVIHDTPKLIFIKRPREFADIGSFGDMGSERILA